LTENILRWAPSLAGDSASIIKIYLVYYKTIFSQILKTHQSCTRGKGI